MLVSSYGAIVDKTLQAGEVYKIDTGHIVAFEEGIGYQVNKVGGWKSTLAVRRRPGRDVHRARASSGCRPAARRTLVRWLIPQLPTKSN